MPLAATITTDEVYEWFRGPYASHRTFYHGHSYTGNALACAAAIANLDVFANERVLERVAPKADRLRARLAAKVAPLTHVGNIRQCGMMVGIELVADARSKEPFSADRRVGRQVILEARRHGVIIRPLGDVVVLMPPLAIAPEEIDLLVDVTATSIACITGP